MSSLEDFSLSELEAEIKHQKDVKPLPIEDCASDLDWSDVYNYIRNTVYDLDMGDGLPDNLEQELLEVVIHTMYGVVGSKCGNVFWEWWRSKV